MSGVCAAGHRSSSTDVCDICGAPMLAQTGLGQGSDAYVDATVVMRPPAPARGDSHAQPTQQWLSTNPVEWVAEVGVDAGWYHGQQTTHRMPTVGPPTIVALPARSVLIGRRSSSRGTHPDLDCSADPGVSRRHAQLTFDGQRWFVEDLGSSNGTFVAHAGRGLPEQPIAVRSNVELAVGDRIYIGAWTSIAVRLAEGRERGG